MSKKFEITYVNPRPKRIVGEEHFAHSIIGRKTSKLAVGESTGRFKSAGYKNIKRIQ